MRYLWRPVTTWGRDHASEVIEMYPSARQVDKSIPDDPADYLRQALECLHAPTGAIMLTASAVDAMLKEKGYTEGVLNSRIQQAARDHLITEEMATWAHGIRLDANAQRHADQAPTRPNTDDARRCIEFALALAEFLFVLPTRVQRGERASRRKLRSGSEAGRTYFLTKPYMALRKARNHTLSAGSSTGRSPCPSRSSGRARRRDARAWCAACKRSSHRWMWACCTGPPSWPVTSCRSP